MDGAPKVYQKREYIILRAKTGYIVYNTNKIFKEGHTHLKSFNMAKTLIDNCIKHKYPKTNNLYLIQSHIRVTDDSKYKQLLEEIKEAKEDKGKKEYYNRR